MDEVLNQVLWLEDPSLAIPVVKKSSAPTFLDQIKDEKFTVNKSVIQTFRLASEAAQRGDVEFNKFSVRILQK